MYLAPDGDELEIASAAASYLAEAMPVERLHGVSPADMSAELRASLAAMGGEPAPGTPAETAEFLRAEYARWGKVIREANIKAE